MTPFSLYYRSAAVSAEHQPQQVAKTFAEGMSKPVNPFSLYYRSAAVSAEDRPQQVAFTQDL